MSFCHKSYVLAQLGIWVPFNSVRAAKTLVSLHISKGSPEASSQYSATS